MVDRTIPQEIQRYVEETAQLVAPQAVHYVDGSQEEAQRLFELLVKNGTCTQLNPEKHPNSYLAWSNPDDVARVEDRTFICCNNEVDAGPTNNYMAPDVARPKLKSLFANCMRGRTMYVIPFCMGPLNSPYARYGIEITDSPYVVVNMRIMTRCGEKALQQMSGKPFVKCLHSVGTPLSPGQTDVPWPCNTKDLIIAHFPESGEVMSFGSGYGGNALLSKKCFALRLASCMAEKQGWLAEHMLIISVTNPSGEKKYMAAAFPSACGKTNLAMIQSTLPGWKVECVGDDIAWMFWNDKGELRAINPEYGFFGVAPGTSLKTNKSAIDAMKKNSIFTNVGRTLDNDVWWEGLTDTPSEGLRTWKGDLYGPNSGPAAQPNARFTAPITQCPTLDPCWNDSEGVPISALIFGGRRQTMVPLVREAATWQQGVFFGASMTSETTAAAKGAIGTVRNDPFAMLPFCGYNMGDYFRHWLSMDKDSVHLPKIFYVNWFLKDADGKFVWPGFGDNIRVLAWIFKRLDNKAPSKKTPIGLIPEEGALELPEGVNYSSLFPMNAPAWINEAHALSTYFAKFKDHLPQAIADEVALLVKSLASS